MSVSAVVVSHGHARELESLLPRLAPQVDELVVVANLPGSAPRLVPPGARVLENARPLRFAANVNRGIAATTRRAACSSRTPTPSPSPDAVAALRRVHGRRTRALRHRRARRLRLARTARWQPSRRRFPTVRGHARPPHAAPPRSSRRSSASARTTTSTRRPTEPVEADWMLGAFLLHAPRDARRARRLGRGLPPLRRGHRPLLPRDAGGLGALVRAGRASSATTGPR